MGTIKRYDIVTTGKVGTKTCGTDRCRTRGKQQIRVPSAEHSTEGTLSLFEYRPPERGVSSILMWE